MDFMKRLRIALPPPYYPKISMDEYAHNRTFWKTVTPFLSSKAPRSARSTLIEKEDIISDHQKLVETLSNLFEEAVDKLDISECNSISNSVGYSYLVEFSLQNIKTFRVLVLLLKSLI